MFDVIVYALYLYVAGTGVLKSKDVWIDRLIFSGTLKKKDYLKTFENQAFVERFKVRRCVYLAVCVGVS